jgi:F-type H+-transporting ATPase subunit gamma
VFEDLSVEKAAEIGRAIVYEYTDPEDRLDACYLVYNEFKSAMTQKVVIEPLFPVGAAAHAEREPEQTPEEARHEREREELQNEFLFEPNREDLLDMLVPMYVEITILRALYESMASELGARMTAMDAATKNASEMISKLTLKYNRARQAAITTEILEIIGGAEALQQG